MLYHRLLSVAVWALTCVGHGHARRLERRQNVSEPIVDLGYSVYQGYYNATSRTNIFKGIRYAAPPTGNLRWQTTQPPVENRTAVIPATAYPPRCPQGGQAPIATNYNFNASGLGSEDCLYLSVWEPVNRTTPLPVFFWIHGGGYGTGQGNNDFSELLMNNNDGFVMVAIQYRLGAFGFLSSAEVAEYGVANAGLRDMHFALKWVQSYIHLFGGDPTRVTIAGESAGGGAVMMLAMANDGRDGTSLFNNIIAASPYLPTQWAYNDFTPSQAYYQLAETVGCLSGSVIANGTIFSCLQAADTIALQNASAHIEGGGKYGQFAFLPVTDGEFITQRPSQQLLAGNVNGLRILSGNNANEGVGFTPQFITTEAEFQAFVQNLFPLMTPSDLQAVYSAYAIPESSIGSPRYSSDGLNPPYATYQSIFGTGYQEAANNLYAETTFICPSYWLADAYTGGGGGGGGPKKAWKYQFSVPPSEHGADLDAYYMFNREALGEGTMTTAFRLAVQEMWGRLIMYDDPTLPSQSVATLTANGTTGDQITAAESKNWATWDGSNMLNLNMTGGVPQTLIWKAGDGVEINITQYIGGAAGTPPLQARFKMVDANSWEGGRGDRCRLWVQLGARVPE